MRMADGTLVANWYRNTQVELEAYDLWLSYSRDGGKTWARPFTPHHDRTKTQHGFASLFEVPTGLGLVWLDAREWELAKDAADGGAVMLRYAAFDRNWKQTADAPLNLRVCDCCQTAVASTTDGIVTAFRDRSDKEIRDIAVSRFENGAWSEPKTVHDDNWEIDSCPVNGPAISGSGRSLAAAWFTAKGDQGQAYAAFSADAGRTWARRSVSMMASRSATSISRCSTASTRSPPGWSLPSSGPGSACGGSMPRVENRRLSRSLDAATAGSAAIRAWRGRATNWCSRGLRAAAPKRVPGRSRSRRRWRGYRSKAGPQNGPASKAA